MTGVRAPAPRRQAGHVSPSLMMCYENATLYYEATTRLQPSIAALIALIGKVERGGGENMDMRTLSATLLHNYRLDGIERDPTVPNNVPGIIPYMATGRQYPKYQVVMQQLIPPGVRMPEDTLEDFEKCALHFMLSATVQPWLRGDEHEVCPLTVGGRSRNPVKPKPKSWSEWPTVPEGEQPPVSRSGQVSRCPIEEGALWTPWGAVAGSSLIGGLAAALNPQRVRVAELKRHRTRLETNPDAVDSVWGSTLSGDLAEVAIYQGPRAPDSTFLRMGPGGSWNDSALPRMIYFDPWIDTDGVQGGWEQESWDITEAEMRGGIDGLVLGTHLPGWLERQGSLRLSQVLDMYYSERGMAMDTAKRACRRKDLNAETVVESTLTQQTDSFARVLYDHVGSVPIAPAQLTIFVNNAVDAYLRFSDVVLWKDLEMAPCAENKDAKPRVELLTVLDGTWTVWEGQRVIRGARLALQRRRALEARRGDSISANSRGTVVLVLALTATNDQGTIDRAKEEMRMSREMMPDVTWLFVTAMRREDYIPFVENPDRDIIMAKESSMENYMVPVIRRLQEVPGRILPALCPALVQQFLKGDNVIEWVPVEPRGPQNEDYVTPEERRLYRVPIASLLGASRVKFTVRSSNYGDLLVCISRVQPGVGQAPPKFPDTPLDNDEQCQSLKANSEVTFVIDQPCTNMADQTCRPVFLWLDVEKTEFKCTEKDCRYPDQVRFSLWHEGLNQLPGCGSSLATSATVSTSLILFMLTIALWR
ncbi:hypothetical protein B566_EDAN008994 [Ephemera danica]|nr:hypothetical protein B566_EDAN008994 [Ephemera danica]